MQDAYAFTCRDCGWRDHPLRSGTSRQASKMCVIKGPLVIESTVIDSTLQCRRLVGLGSSSTPSPNKQVLP